MTYNEFILAVSNINKEIVVNTPSDKSIAGTVSVGLKDRTIVNIYPEQYNIKIEFPLFKKLEVNEQESLFKLCNELSSTSYEERAKTV